VTTITDRPVAVVIAEPDIPREEWLQVRRQGLGSSDAAAILGEDKWKGPAHVYLDKTGSDVLLGEDEESEAAYWGRVLEEPVARRFQEKTGIVVLPNRGTLQNVERPWQLANLDRETADGGILECKTTSAWNADDWQDDIPPRVWVQVEHQLAVTGLSHAYVAGLIGGQKFRVERVERDEEFIGHLNELEAQFWQQVLDQRPPEFDGLEQTRQLIERLYKARPGSSVEVSPIDYFPLRDAYWEAHAAMKAAEMRKDEAGNRIRALLGENEIGLINGQQVVTWIEAPRAGYTVAPTTSRTLRPKKA
jgi:putative phage-type endonuclease